jgi:hypothetical protein
MVHLELTTTEGVLLKGILEYDLRELHNEISNTENWKYKEGLKERDALLRKILAALKEV